LGSPTTMAKFLWYGPTNFIITSSWKYLLAAIR